MAPRKVEGMGQFFLVYFSLIVLNKFSVWEEGKFPTFHKCS